MIIESYDGLNMALKVSPRSLKVLTEVLKAVDEAASVPYGKAAEAMEKASYKYDVSDVAAVVRQFILTTAPITDQIRDTATVSKEDLEKLPVPANQKPS